MMQCSVCGATLPTGIGYCSHCGTRLTETPSPVAPPFPASGEPYREARWIEFGGGQVSPALPVSTEATYPPISPVPGTGDDRYGPSSNSSFPPASPSPSSVQPVTPAPKRRGRTVVITSIVMGLLVIVGSVSVGIQVSQSQASSAADAHRLYQRVTSQTPTFLSPLTNPTMTQWDVDEKPTYGCKVNSDGLHVHVNDSHVFFYCTSGFGLFRTFAFQIKMKILSGEGGGLIFRADTTRGNFYYFHVYPNGWYRIYLSQKKKLTTELSEGTASSVVSGFGQENTLTVIAMGSRMDFYVNQTFLTEVVDPTYTNGSLAVLASTSTSPAEVVYTNAQIWEL